MIGSGRMFVRHEPNVDTGGEFRRLPIVILIRAAAFAGNNDSQPDMDLS
jgi:hypothetical protein